MGAQWCRNGECKQTSEEEHPKDHHFFIVSQKEDETDKKSNREGEKNDVEIRQGIRSIQILHDAQGKRGVPIGEHTETGKHGAIGERHNPTCPSI